MKHLLPLYKPYKQSNYQTKLIYRQKLETYAKRTEKELSPDETRKFLERLKKQCDVLNLKKNAAFIHYIILDKDLLEKIVFVSDGSYRNHRIDLTDIYNPIHLFTIKKVEKFFMPDHFNVTEPLSHGYEMLDFIVNHFEKVFVQIDKAYFDIL